MIRVNLLPQKRDARGATPQRSQKWLLAVLGVVVLEIIGLFIFHQHKVEQLDAQRKQTRALQTEIETINKLVSNHEEIKKTLVVLRAREDAIAQLQAGRTGPTAVLLEVAQLLTLNKGPTSDPDKINQLRKENPLAVYNPGWDTRRLWLTNYEEKNRAVRIEGLARDANDVSELAQRLKLSVYFYDVEILPGKKEIEAKSKVELVHFALSLKVRY
jgi:type IV pilus assembly protein PilN